MNGFRVYQTLFFVQTACLNTFNIISTFITSIMIGLAASGETTTLTILSAIATAFGILIGVFNAINFVFKPQSTAVGAASSSKQYGGLAKELIVEIMSYEVMFGGMSQNEVSQFSIPDVGLTTNLKSGSSAALGVSRSMHDPRYEPSPEVEIHINDHHVDQHYVGDSFVGQEGQLNHERYVDFETYKNRLLYYSSREQIISITEPGLLLIGYFGGKTVFDRTYVSSLPAKDLEFMSSYVDKLENSSDKRKLKKIITRMFISNGRVTE